MEKKSSDPVIYEIERELFFEKVEDLTCREIGKFHHDYSAIVNTWGEVPLYVLSSLLVECFLYFENSEQVGVYWKNLYPETKNMLISLAHSINSKLGLCYQDEKSKEEYISKLRTHHQSFEKINDKYFIMMITENILTECRIYKTDDKDKYEYIYKEIKKIVESISFVEK